MGLKLPKIILVQIFDIIPSVIKAHLFIVKNGNIVRKVLWPLD